MTGGRGFIFMTVHTKQDERNFEELRSRTQKFVYLL